MEKMKLELTREGCNWLGEPPAEIDPDINQVIPEEFSVFPKE
jgi:hypothetical protein